MKHNREHMKAVNGWDDDRFDTFLTDGFVFINRTNNPLNKTERKEYREHGIPPHQFPDLTNFWDMKNTQWEY